MQINLSKFKKISEDDHSATLQHPEGHHFKIAKKALSKKMQGELSSLPIHLDEGGMAPDKNYSEQPPANPTQPIVINVGQPAPQAAPQQQPFISDPVANYLNAPQPRQSHDLIADAGLPNPPENQMDYLREDIVNRYGNVLPQNQLDALKRNDAYQQNLGQQIQAQAEAKAKTLGSPQEYAKYGLQAPDEVASQMPIPQGSAAVAPGGASISSLQAPSQPPQDQDPFQAQLQAQLGSLGQGIGEQKMGLAGEARALGEQGRKEAEAIDAGIKKQEQGIADFQANNKGFQEHQQAFLEDYQNGHIDPNRVMSSMGTGKRISTAIGLILGGIGGGLTHQENPVMKMLQERINLDVRAQEAELGKKKNLLEANRQFYGDMGLAIQATTAQQMGIVSSQLKKAAAEAQDPLAKARALQAAGQLDERIAPMLSQMAMRQTLLSSLQQPAQGGGSQPNPSMTIRALVPEGQQQAAFKELGEAQSMIRAKDNILSAFDKINELSTPGKYVTSPIQTRSQIAAARDPVLAQLSKETAGRFTETDSKFIGSLFPTALDDDKTRMLKRTKLLSLISEKLNFPMLESYGIRMGNTPGPSRFDNQGQKKITLGAPVAPKK